MAATQAEPATSHGRATEAEIAIEPLRCRAAKTETHGHSRQQVAINGQSDESASDGFGRRPRIPQAVNAVLVETMLVNDLDLPCNQHTCDSFEFSCLNGFLHFV